MPCVDRVLREMIPVQIFDKTVQSVVAEKGPYEIADLHIFKQMWGKCQNSAEHTNRSTIAAIRV